MGPAERVGTSDTSIRGVDARTAAAQLVDGDPGGPPRRASPRATPTPAPRPGPCAGAGPSCDGRRRQLVAATRHQVSAKNASSQSSSSLRTQARTGAGRPAAAAVKSACRGPRAAASLQRPSRRAPASISGDGAATRRSAQRAGELQRRRHEPLVVELVEQVQVLGQRRTRAAAAAAAGSPANGMKTSENVVRHRKSASHSRSARSGLSPAVVAVAQPCSPGWCPARPARAGRRRARPGGKGRRRCAPEGSPLMSMVTLTVPWCGGAPPADRRLTRLVNRRDGRWGPAQR